MNVTKLYMVQIRYTKAAGGGVSYYKVSADELALFKEAYAGTHPCLKLHASNGTVHNFMREHIREFSERPFDPNYQRRSK